MQTTNIPQVPGTSASPKATDMPLVGFRMPRPEYRRLKRHVFERCSVQEFVLTAVREKMAAEKRQRKGATHAAK